MLLAQTYPSQSSPPFHIRHEQSSSSLRQHRLQQHSQTSHLADFSHHRQLEAPASARLEFYPRNFGVDIDIDIDIDAGTLDRGVASQSPISTQSLLPPISLIPQASSLPGAGSLATIAVPRRADPAESLLVGFQDLGSPSSSAEQSVDESTLLSDSDLMHHADTWLVTGQMTPKSIGRLSHHRESSLSSLGSAGPASPYSQNTSNPQIAVTDSLGETYSGLTSHDDYNNYHLVKGPHDGFYANYPNYSAHSAAANSAYTAPRARRLDDRLLSTRNHNTLPQPAATVSMAESAGGDSPATPSSGEPTESRRRRIEFSGIPKLDRTMTDVYSDELYSPEFTIMSSSPSPSSQLAVSPSSDLFAQRLQAANSQHLSAAHSPASSAPRDRSPFRQGSPLAPVQGQDFPSSVPASQMRFGPAQSMRERRKVDQDVQSLQHQLMHMSDTTTPPTISPKDAMLEFDEPEGASNFVLFPTQSTSAMNIDQMNNSVDHQFAGLDLETTPFNFDASRLPTTVQIPQHYPFIAQPANHGSIMPLDTGSVVSSDMSARQASHGAMASPRRPAVTNADGGTYTCTYHGCTLRFNTPALLQKHKREGHRQAHGLNGSRKTENPGMTSSLLLNSQAGPHRCDRINPITGKPCSTIFSRPYDLTRHEDTIHNIRKQKVRCNLCTEEKTFSRADALTRHFRVCHPEVDLPGKHRRRTGQNA